MAGSQSLNPRSKLLKLSLKSYKSNQIFRIYLEKLFSKLLRKGMEVIKNRRSV